MGGGRARAAAIRAAILAAIVTMGVPGAHAAPSRLWTLLGPGTVPTARYAHAMAYEASHGIVVMFGGRQGFGSGGDTWLYDGLDWRRSSAAGPSARNEHAMAYDPSRGRVVLFGGLSSTGPYLDDTWEWDGTAWRRMPATASPPPRGGHTLAYDPVTHRVLLFGGSTSTTRYADTWTWTGATWVQATPANSPSARTSHMMETSPSGGVVLFGGYDGTSILGDTWEWDGTSWSQKAPAADPGPRMSAPMIFDSNRNESVLSGGFRSSGSLSDTWTWNGTSWTELAFSTAPSPRNNHAMAYVFDRDTAVLFGGSAGSDETWIIEFRELDVTPPEITAVRSPPANAAGWNNGPVTVSWTVIERESRIRSTSGCTDGVVGSDTAGSTFTCHATNVDGSTSEASVTVRLDRTPPSVAATRAPPPNEWGWTNRDVEVRFTCADGLSGVASCSPPVVLATEGAAESASGESTDVAGNSAIFVMQDIRIDKTEPLSHFESDNGSVLLAASSVVSGFTTDGLSGVRTVAVVFEPVTGGAPITRPTFTSCAEDHSSCAWIAPAPRAPGVYRATARGWDYAGNRESAAASILVIVV